MLHLRGRAFLFRDHPSAAFLLNADLAQKRMVTLEKSAPKLAFSTSLTTPAASRVFCFSSFKHTPTSAQTRALTGHEFRRDRRSLASMSNLITRPVLTHRLGVAHQTSLRSLWTMMIYSNSPRLGEAGSLISLPVTALQDYC